MANFYCEYCGQKFSSVSSLTGSSCYRHPDGANKGRHKLYEGDEKSQYTCKYCGQKSYKIKTLVLNRCHKNPVGDRHIPAL